MFTPGPKINVDNFLKFGYYVLMSDTIFDLIVQLLRSGLPVRDVCRQTGADKAKVSLIGKTLGLKQKRGRPKTLRSSATGTVPDKEQQQ
jgi:hypothetical protein